MSNGKADEEMDVDYGIVEIIGGKFKGLVGYYDDDEGQKYAIVYFGRFPIDGYELVPHKYLRPTKKKFLPMERLKKDHPALCALMGIGE